MPVLPVGTVTFLFTDIEGSSRLWESYPEAMKGALARHDNLLKEIIEAWRGYVFKNVGDGIYSAFQNANDAVQAALLLQRTLLDEEPVLQPASEIEKVSQSPRFNDFGHETCDARPSIRVRIALHTGHAELSQSDYSGPAVNRLARIVAAGHGGQILLSLATHELVRDQLPAGAYLLDLQEHRLQEQARPERLFQLAAPGLPVDFPPLRSLDYQPTNLPAQSTPIIGREQEIQALHRLLARPEVRLLSLTGPAGTGKTRLALQVAGRQLGQFENGVFLVQLAPVTDPALAGGAIVQALGLKEAAGRPPVESLKHYLRDKQMLLVLDNFEQIMAAAPLVAELIEAAPRLKIIVTSREVLKLYGEQEFAVPPLSLPECTRPCPPGTPRLAAENVEQYEAARLFIQRARAIKPDFQVNDENAPDIAEICQRLDGLPLAIELAAARVKMFSPAALLARLAGASRGGRRSSLEILNSGARDLPQRQQTLRGAIGWSYEMLNPAEKMLFRRMAVFAGTCAFEAIQAVCDPELKLPLDALDVAASLVDKSLLRQAASSEAEPRFWMLETIREFAWEILQAEGELVAIRDRHACYYVEQVQAAEDGLKGPQQFRWLGWLTQERNNIWAALQWLSQSQAAEQLLDAARMCGSLGWYWAAYGYLSAGRRWIEKVIQSSPVFSQPPANDEMRTVQAQLYCAAGLIYMNLGEYETAIRYGRQSQALFRSGQNAQGSGRALFVLGAVEYYQGNFGLAKTRLEESAIQCRRANDDWGSGLALYALGDVARFQGDYELAQALLTESLELFQDVEDQAEAAMPLLRLGTTAFNQGDYELARDYLNRSLAIARRVDNRWLLAYGLQNLGSVAIDQGHYSEAVANLEESLLYFNDIGDKWGQAVALNALATAEVRQQSYSTARELCLRSLAIRQELGDKSGLAFCLENLAALSLHDGAPVRAAYLLGLAEDLLKSSGSSLPEVIARQHANLIEQLTHCLGSERLAEYWQAGKALSPEQAINRPEPAIL